MPFFISKKTNEKGNGIKNADGNYAFKR